MKKISIILFILINTFVYSQDFKFGVQTHFGQFYRDDIDSSEIIKMLDSIKSAGINLIRDECYWYDIEKSQGTFNFPEIIDFYIKEAKERDIEVLLILNYNNPIYSGNPNPGGGVLTQINREAYTNYCKEVVKRYSPLGVKYFELWNEPNIPQFWSPAPNPTDYADLVKSAYPAIKEIDSSVVVLIGATSPAEGDPSPSIDWLSFMTDLFLQVGKDYCDGFSFHLYRVDRGPELWLEKDVQDLQSIIGNDIPLYITEVGYHTASSWPNITLDQQSKYLARLYLLSQKFPMLKMLTWYDLKNDGNDAGFYQHNFGLLNFDLSHKPAFISYQTLNQEIGNKDFVDFTSSNGNYQMKFSDTLNVTALWNTVSSTNITLTTEKNHIKVTESNGRSSYYFRNNNSINIKLSDSPKYVRELSNFPEIGSFKIIPEINYLVAGEEINLNLVLYSKTNEPIYVDSTAVNWKVDKSIASVDAYGRLRALQTGIFNVQAEFENSIYSEEFNIISVADFYSIESFNSTDNFNITFSGIDPSTNISIIDTNSTDNDMSLLINYSFKYSSLANHKIIFDTDYFIPSQPDSIFMDIYNNGNSHAFEFVFEDSDQEVFSVSPSSLRLKSLQGWETLVIPINKFGVRFSHPARLKKIIFYVVKNGAVRDSVYSGNVIFDNLRAKNGILTSVNEDEIYIEEMNLLQNYPNPFNSSTTIEFSLKESGFVSLRIFDSIGREIKSLVNDYLSGGSHRIYFNASQLASGAYFISIFNGQKTITKKMLILK